MNNLPTTRCTIHHRNVLLYLMSRTEVFLIDFSSHSFPHMKCQIQRSSGGGGDWLWVGTGGRGVTDVGMNPASLRCLVTLHLCLIQSCLTCKQRDNRCLLQNPTDLFLFRSFPSFPEHQADQSRFLSPRQPLV